MRWGAASAKPDALRWVRPLRGIVCTLATQHETAEIVPLDIGGLASGDITCGHRFMAPEPIKVRRYEDYADALQKAKVVLDLDRRKAIILADAKSLAFAQGLELVEDEGLLEEVAGLVEWPVALMGEFEADFLDIPPGGDPRHHPRQPEVLRPAGRRRQARQPVHPRRQPRRFRRRRGDRGRQRPRRAGAPRRRAPLLADRPPRPARLQGQGREAARPAPGEARSARHRLPREARHAGRTHRPDRDARARDRAARSAPTSSSRRARQDWPRPISSPRWSASSPSCRA